MTNAFIDLNLDTCLVKALAMQNITIPTPIQQSTIPAFLEEKDLIAESHTGSGKTIAFVAPLLQKIDADRREVQAIILAPTHELVMQIHNQVNLLAKNAELPITSLSIMGEVSIDKQIKALKEKKPQIIVGSAGRVLDLISKKKISAHTVHTIILDEADNLLGQNQANTIKKLIHQIPKHRQLCIFSASISASTIETANDFMNNSVFIKTAQQTILNPNIEHLYITGEKREKFDLLRRLLVATHTPKALIFVSQNTDVKTLIEKLEHHQYTVAAISGKISKEDRKNALARFKSGKVRLLISSDLSARGLDIADITHVIHFDLPLTASEYLHRAGRTARGVKCGTSICITTPKELGAIRIYEREFGIKILPIDIVKGHIHSLTGATLTHTLEVAQKNTLTPKVEKKKDRNKYPKGFSKTGSTPKVNPVTTKESKPSKALNSKYMSKHLLAEIKKSKTTTEGSLSSVMDLLKDAKFGRNHE